MASRRQAAACLLALCLAATAAGSVADSGEGRGNRFGWLSGFIRRLVESPAQPRSVTLPAGSRVDASGLDLLGTDPDPETPQLLPPLWNADDFDSAQPASTTRTLLHAPGEEVEHAPDPDPDPQPNPARRVLRNDDFVFAAPSNPARLPLAQASRYWRKGMRAVFVLDQPEDRLPQGMAPGAARYRETFAWYPNFRRMPNNLRDHYLEGDRRAAMAPVLAYATIADPPAMAPWTNIPNVTAPGGAAQRALLGAAARRPGSPRPGAARAGEDPFLWMLSGDDDTVWFMRGLKALLRDYDPQLPYFLSDSMYIGSKSPQPGVWEMRCYPCHLPWGRWRRASSRRLLAANAPPKTCECSTKALCQRRFPGNVTRCMDEWEGPVPWGGVGFIFSIGFFKQMAALKGGTGLRAYEECINNPAQTVMSFPEGGDAFMSRCFWRLGFPITDPGYTHLGRYMGEALNLKVLYDAPTNLSRGQLPTDALGRWTLGISMHLGARQQRSFRAAALTIKYIISVYDLVAELLWPTVRK